MYSISSALSIFIPYVVKRSVKFQATLDTVMAIEIDSRIELFLKQFKTTEVQARCPNLPKGPLSATKWTKMGFLSEG